MSGTQAFIAFQVPGNATPSLLTYNVQRGHPLRPGPISFDVLDSAVQISSGKVAIFVSLRFNPGQSRVLNHVWARGDSVDTTTFQPAMHSLNPQELSGLRRIDMASAAASAAFLPPNYKLKLTHGFLNILAWNVVFALGAMEPRYVRLLIPGAASGKAWFLVHVFVQCVGAGLAIPGFITGILIGARQGHGPPQHRCVGITLFSILCLQFILALFRPAPGAGRRRTIWFLSHRVLGIGMLGMGWYNTYSGLRMLAPAAVYHHVGVSLLPALASLSLLLELLHFLARIFAHASAKVSSVNGSEKADAKDAQHPAAASAACTKQAATSGDVLVINIDGP